MRLPLGPDAAYRAVAGRETRWDGRFFLGVITTGIYCRPSCPARTPRQENCRFFPTAAAAVAAGLRACRRCRPDALPGSRQWDMRNDTVSRAVRLIADGALDTGNVEGLAALLAVSPRHLHRILVAEVGASAQQLASTRRAHAARMLIAESQLSLTEVAYAAGFGSLRQFNDVMKSEFGMAPNRLRHPDTAGKEQTGERESEQSPTLSIHLAYRRPLAFATLARTLAAHAVDGVEHVDGVNHTRVVDAPGGPATARFSLDHPTDAGTSRPPSIAVTLRLSVLSDLMPVVTRLRRWLDLDADPEHITSDLLPDRIVGPLVSEHLGLRVPGSVDGAELAMCAVLGQQVSVAAARTFQSKLVKAFGREIPGGGSLMVFPSPARVAGLDPRRLRETIGLTSARAETLHKLATVLADGLALTPGSDPETVEAELLAIPGIGPWTVGYISIRALRNPDAFIASDLVVRKALARRTEIDLPRMTSRACEDLSKRWSPWRAYALQHLWTQEVYT